MRIRSAILILPYMCIIMLISCSPSIRQRDFKCVIVAPFNYSEVTKVLPCDKPGPLYYGQIGEWDCVNTGTVKVGTICHVYESVRADLAYYHIRCGDVVGWVTSDFVEKIE